MSLPKKGSRQLIIGNQTYLWYIRRKPTYMQDVFNCPWAMAIQLAGVDGTVLLVEFNLSRPDNIISPHQTSITPALVSHIINQALHAGWQPKLPGSAYRFSYSLIRDGINSPD